MSWLYSRRHVVALLVLSTAFLARTDSRGGAAGESAVGPKVFRAGAAAINVTPQKLPVIVNGGFLEGTASTVTDPLYARCLVLDDGTVRIAVAVVDNCVIPRPILDEAKALAQKATGIPADRMLISATHCHSAPSVCGALGSGVEEEYARWLPGKIAEGIARAQKNLAPARIGWAVGKDPKNVFCRRFLMKPGTAPTNPFSGTANDQAQMNPGYQNPNAIRRTGPVDDAVSVLSVQSPGGRPIALVGNYSTHYAGAPPLSADYFGVFCRRIGELVGGGKSEPPFVGIMSNGTSGDANCCDFVNPPRKFDRFTVGEDVAQAAFEAYGRIRYYDWVPLAMEERLLTLGVRMPSAEEVAKAKEHLAKVPGGKPRDVTDVYARETVILSEMPATRELKLQAIRIGPLGIAAMPNEVFGSTGLAIKRDSPLRPTINIELANGYYGYLPPPDQFPLGGYTTWRARSSCLEVQAEPKIRAAVLELLNRVANQRRDEQPVPPAMPLALKVVGTQILNSRSEPVLLRGVNAASLEWTSNGEGHILTTVKTAIRDWHVNHVRLPLAQDRWFGKAPEQKDEGKAYRALVHQIVDTCASQGVYIILDLHWSDTAEWGKNIGQHSMPDENSLAFWRDIAPVYANHPAVIYDIYNEPHDVPWDVWLNGGKVTDRPNNRRAGPPRTFEAVGMQKLLDTVRAAGAKNVVIVGGLDWAYDFSGILEGRQLKDPDGNGVIYANHAYNNKGHSAQVWIARMEKAAAKLPVIVSEFGGSGGPNRRTRRGGPGASATGDDWLLHVMQALDDHKWSWTAWDLHPAAGPTLISDWNYTPTPDFGVFVKQALEGKLPRYTPPVPSKTTPSK